MTEKTQRGASAAISLERVGTRTSTRAFERSPDPRRYHTACRRAAARQIQDMKEKQAQALRDAWGDRPCPHPSYSREYDSAGARTGDYFCAQCGAKVSFRERAEALAKQREPEG